MRSSTFWGLSRDPIRICSLFFHMRIVLRLHDLGPVGARRNFLHFTTDHCRSTTIGIIVTTGAASASARCTVIDDISLILQEDFYGFDYIRVASSLTHDYWG